MKMETGAAPVLRRRPRLQRGSFLHRYGLGIVLPDKVEAGCSLRSMLVLAANRSCRKQTVSRELGAKQRQA